MTLHGMQELLQPTKTFPTPRSSWLIAGRSADKSGTAEQYLAQLHPVPPTWAVFQVKLWWTRIPSHRQLGLLNANRHWADYPTEGNWGCWMPTGIELTDRLPAIGAAECQQALSWLPGGRQLGALNANRHWADCPAAGNLGRWMPTGIELTAQLQAIGAAEFQHVLSWLPGCGQLGPLNANRYWADCPAASNWGRWMPTGIELTARPQAIGAAECQQVLK